MMEGGLSNHSGPLSTKTSKRPKIAVACDSCRNRKVRCDGVSPVCAPCRKRNGVSAKCSWDGTPSRTTSHSTLHYVSQLEERIRELEQVATPAGVRSIHNEVAEGCGTRTSDLLPHSEAQDVGRVTERSFVDLPRPEAMIPRWPGRSFNVSNPDQHMALAMVGVLPDNSRVQEFVDSSSAGSFIQHVRRTVQQKLNLTSTSSSTSSQPHELDTLPPMVPNESLSNNDPGHHLPTRRVANRLMAVYWQYIHSLYPFVGRSLTEVDYESFWRGEGPAGHEQSFLCLLNVMFALSAKVAPSTPPPDRQALASVFYARARKLLDLDIAPSVRHVQILLLLGLHLQSTNESLQCWIYIGLAVRIAQHLELHRPETGLRFSDPHYRNLIRKVWHGCVLMDRVLAMTYGRPCMISRAVADSVPHPVPVEAEYILHHEPPTHAPISGSIPTRVDFFNQTLSLYDLVFEILNNFYLHETERFESLEEVYHHYCLQSTNGVAKVTVLDIDQRLVQWNKDLPPHLQISSDKDDLYNNLMLRRQAVILHQRYLHVRLLLLRPILSALVTLDKVESASHLAQQATLSRQTIFRCSLLCIQLAQEAIDVVYKRRIEYPGGMGTLSAWWYNMLFLYTSATVLIAARLSPSILAEISEGNVITSWQQAMEALGDYSPLGSPVQRSLTTLRILYNTVPQQFSVRQEILANNNILKQTARLTDTAAESRQEDWRENRVPTSIFASAPQGHAAIPELDPLFLEPEEFLALDAPFGPNDMSWLTAAPFD